MGPPIAHIPYPILLKYQKFVDKEMRLLENAGYISKHLSPWAAPVIIVGLPRKPDLLKPHKEQLCSVLDYLLCNKPINVAHNGSNVIS